MNTEVTWNDQSLADAIIQKCEGMSIKIFPDTAMQIAQEIRSNSDGNDIIAITSAVKQAISTLLNQEENSVTANINTLDGLIARISSIQTKYAQGDIDDIQARGQVHGIMLPAQDSLMEETVGQINTLLNELEALEASAQEEYVKMEDPSELNRLKEDAARLADIARTIQSDPNVDYAEKRDAVDNSSRAKIAYDQELQARRTAKSKYNAKKTEANVKKTLILVLDQAYKLLDTELYSPEAKRDRSGYRKSYFDMVLKGIKATKTFYAKVRAGAIVPDITDFERHEFRYLGRDRKTKGVQSTSLSPNKISISMDELRESPAYEVLKNTYDLSDDEIEAITEKINEQEDTWQKGQLIFALLDPPAAIGTMPSLGTATAQPPESGRKGVALSREIKYNQSIHRSIQELLDMIEAGRVDEMLAAVDSSGAAYWTDARKKDESLDDRLHWGYFLALSNEGLQDRYGRIAHDKYIDSLPENIVAIVDRDDLPSDKEPDYEEKFNALSPADQRDAELKNKVLDEADKFAAHTLTNSDKVINNVIHNKNTPSWILMKLMNTLNNLDLREAALKVLIGRNIFPVESEEKAQVLQEDGTPATDESGNLVYKAKYERDNFGNVVFDTSNATEPGVARGRAFGAKTAQTTDPQSASIQTQMTNNENQIQQLNNQINQIRQTNENLQKNMETLKGEQARAEEANKQTINNLAQSNPVQPTQPLAPPMAKFKVVYKKNA